MNHQQPNVALFGLFIFSSESLLLLSGVEGFSFKVNLSVYINYMYRTVKPEVMSDAVKPVFLICSENISVFFLSRCYFIVFFLFFFKSMSCIFCRCYI